MFIMNDSACGGLLYNLLCAVQMLLKLSSKGSHYVFPYCLELNSIYTLAALAAI